MSKVAFRLAAAAAAQKPINSFLSAPTSIFPPPQRPLRKKTKMKTKTKGGNKKIEEHRKMRE